jgi:Flp pilus assembly protein TadG
VLTTRFRRPARRRGAAVVESALVLSVFLLLLFGMFEYCRFLMVLQVSTNAARSGARYAVVNTDKPATFNAADYTDAAGNTYPSIASYTTSQMGGVQQNVEGYRVATFAVDPTGLTLSPPVVRPKTASTSNPVVYPDPFNPTDPNAVPWNQASFTEKIGVTVSGTYRPLLPSLLLMPAAVPLNVTAIMETEG